MKLKLNFIPAAFAAASILVLSFLSGCSGESYKEKGSPEYINEINKWHTERIENLKKENGWLNLVGLFWLKDGDNKFGSGESNDIIFPENAPESIGVFNLKDSIVTIKINDGINVLLGDSLITGLEMKHDQTGNPTILSLGSFKWFIIKRGNKYGIRLRDLNSPQLKEFTGVDRFPVNDDWKIEADFEPYNPPKKIIIPTILGTEEEETTPGKLTFTIGQDKYSLEPVDAGRSLFIIFADETNGEETYGAGRFLVVDKPDSTGSVIIDFNKAYNPPCAFSKYATCPLPPKSNFLKTRITAGEKNYGHGH